MPGRSVHIPQSNRRIRETLLIASFPLPSLLAIAFIPTIGWALPPSAQPDVTEHQAIKPMQDADNIVLNFPADHSIGIVRPFRSPGSFKHAQAKGQLVLPKVNVELVLNYEAAFDLSPLRNIPANSLYKLNLSKLEIHDNQLKNIEHLTGLHSLSLKESDVTDQGLEFLRNMKKLSNLNLGATLVTSKGLSKLIALTGLEELYLDRTNVSDDGLQNLVQFKSLKVLSLAKTHISDRGLKALAPSPHLRTLDIEYNTGITDAGIANLKEMKNLTELQLANASVTGGCIKYLKLLPSLKSVIYSANNFTAKDLEELHKVMPHCRLVNYDQRTQVPAEMFAPLH